MISFSILYTRYSYRVHAIIIVDSCSIAPLENWWILLILWWGLSWINRVRCPEGPHRQWDSVDQRCVFFSSLDLRLGVTMLSLMNYPRSKIERWRAKRSRSTSSKIRCHWRMIGSGLDEMTFTSWQSQPNKDLSELSLALALAENLSYSGRRWMAAV